MTNKYRIITPYGHEEIVYGTSYSSYAIWNNDGDWIAQVPEGWLVIVERNVDPPII